MDRMRQLVTAAETAAAVTVLDADDVADLVCFARRQGLRITTRPSCHGPVDRDTIRLHTGRLTGLTVCPDSRTARVGAGVTAGRLAAVAAGQRLVANSGSSPYASATGTALGGGIGWSARKYGLASDSVTAFDVVDADGNRLRASAHENEDLFWALSGGGGDYAIVTGMQTRLHAEPELIGGTIAWPIAAAGAVFAAFTEVVADAPEELMAWVTLVHPPGGTPAVRLSSAFLGTAQEARVLLKPFDEVGGAVRDTRRALAPGEVDTLSNLPMASAPAGSRGELLSGFDDAMAAALLAEPIDPLYAVQVRHLGGRLTQDSNRGPHGPIAEEFMLFMAGPAASGPGGDDVADKQQELTAALGGAVTGRSLLSLLGPGESAARAFGAEELGLLQEIKAAWDPTGLFVDEHPMVAGQKAGQKNAGVG